MKIVRIVLLMDKSGFHVIEYWTIQVRSLEVVEIIFLWKILRNVFLR